jgi:excisionase family DNA binding protein
MATWITTAQAVELSGYNAQYMRWLIRDKRIKAQKFGQLWQVDKQSLLAYMRQADKVKAQDKRHGAREHKT